MTGAPDLASIRADLEAARERAGQKLDAGLKGVEAARLEAAASDQAAMALWQTLAEGAATKASISLLAVGGYGRSVRAPYSDLDLMLLRPARLDAAAEALIETLLQSLWDLGFKVGWSVRTGSEALKLARQDMTIRTSLLEARHLAGDARLSEVFLQRFRRMVKSTDPRPFIAAKLEERDIRHAKAGTVRYQVEPNVKDGKGGLRDLNSLFWIARALAPDSDMGRAALEGLLTSKEQRLAVQAFDFLWAVRIHLHRLAGRAQDKLAFEYQPEVASRMGWTDRKGEPAVERFMRRYFVIARDVGALTRAMSAKLEAMQAKPAVGLMRLLPLPRRRPRPSAVEGVVEEAGRLTVTGSAALSDHPVRMLELFRETDRQGLDLHPDAFGAVARSLDRVTPALRRDPEAARAFIDVLAHGRRPYRTLSLMNEAGLLGRFVPEFARIVGQTQFNRYHAYTVDEHTLQAIGIMKDIETGALRDDHPLSHSIFPLIDDREVLYLALLLHDVGKGGTRGQLEDGGIAARRACERLGLSKPRAELTAWLVEHHLVLSDFAQKRDATDPATIAAFANIVEDLERLRMLLVLTAADVRAVGPGVWNGWKGQLMRDLYAATEARFRGENAPGDIGPEPKTSLMARAVKQGAAAELVHRRAWDTSELTFVARDRHGLFADVVTALAAEGADVTGARVHTSDDGWAIDVFQLQHSQGGPYAEDDPRVSRRLEKAVVDAALGRRRPGPPASQGPRTSVFDVSPVVVFDNPQDGAATIIEASGRDRPGLLADLAHALSDGGLTIRSAHIESHGVRAVDAFYVTTRAGARLNGRAEQARVRAALLAALRPPVEPVAPKKMARARASGAR
ncbi:MAG TPA: [protein-PII] uridylyltransferase [Brevundimonas sp.]|uniref:[protein-PII] uridylyltransferase n=1 Tax=Brevundimonas sp. TaxID=1871086 RepID=UPI002D0B331C|nr:[protein-PII] uridylyltransferase [Brevundimonas sp.]HRH21024.1 [protein-PII] uridylyltransferase [Brevundimonas sp.]